jgi:hypothetical protein
MTRNAILQELEATRARLREREADLARERAERQADHDRLAAEDVKGRETVHVGN